MNGPAGNSQEQSTHARQQFIEARNLARHYAMSSEVIRAVDGVDLKVAQGEFAALLGPSGSGKSTLLHMLAGMDHPTGGSLRVEGLEMGKLGPVELACYRRDMVGMVFQAFNLIPSLRVFENVELPLRLAEQDRDERRKKVEDALQRVGLANRARHRPGELSGGEQQRVALARALVNEPKLLLADEPTGNLDSRTGEEIMRMIEKFNRVMGMTVLLVTHEQALAERFAKRMIYMADGKILAGPVAEGGAG
jgi:putative ABC transport system ATP-binding protein